MQEKETKPIDKTRQLKEELVRLRLKLQESTDRDIRSVLQLRIDQILGELPPETVAQAVTVQEEVPEVLQEPEAGVEPPTPAQLEEADRLIRQSRVEKMRGNAAKATECLKQAAEAAPGSVAVLEALGDDLQERKQIKNAMAVYKKAFLLDPKNVGVEEKLARMALVMSSLGSVEDQMRRNLSDSPFLNESDAVARLPAATFLSALVPGVGHLVLGKTTQGFTILVAWILSLVWFLAHWFDFVKLLSMASNGREKPNMVVIVPLFLMAAIYLGTLNSLKGMRGTVHKKHVDHPRPPVDLPFD